MTRTLHTVVFRASMINDPEDTEADGFIQLEMEAWEVAPTVRLIGGATTDANGYKTNDPKLIRRLVSIEFLEFVKQVTEGENQDYALYSKFIEHVMTRRFIWIYRVYQSGDAHGTGPLPRADFDRTDLTETTTTNSFWNLREELDGDDYPFEPAGHLPMEVVTEDSIEPPSHEGNGIYHLEIELAKADVDVVAY